MQCFAILVKVDQSEAKNQEIECTLMDETVVEDGKEYTSSHQSYLVVYTI